MNSIVSLPIAGVVIPTSFSLPLLGARVEHRHLGLYGRLTGTVRQDRGQVWFEVALKGGGFRFWPNCNIVRLGPIPIPKGAA